MLLLENNQYSQDAQALLDWVIDRCFTGPNEVADGCFMALAQVFNNRYVDSTYCITGNFYRHLIFAIFALPMMAPK